ncbi:MAG: VWA domain-containing protein [Acidobacteriota bacterium]
MLRTLLLTALAPAALFAQDGDLPVFRSDVSLVRVDVQVLDRTSRPVAYLQKEDFTLRENGKELPIVNFASEKMPIDILFLLDVSGSMRPHVERIARAAQSALDSLSEEDRLAIMVFDRQTRTRLPFTPIGDNVYRQFDLVLDRERFNGGTDITRGMLDAASYMQRHARKDARRAIIILTDDQTEFGRDDEGVGQALIDADAVMSALLAPNAMRGYPPGGGGGYPPSGRRRGGGGWGGLGTIVLGGGGYPGGGGGGISLGRLSSAGTAEIARASGGDSMAVDGASALETTVARLRQRYALYFNLPAGARQGQQRRLQVSLAGNGARRYPDAELRYRQNYLAPASNDSDPNVTVITDAKPEPAASATDPERPALRRPPDGDGSGGGRGPNPAVGASEAPAPAPAPASGGGWRRADAADTPAPATEPAPATTPAPATAAPAKKGGWRRVTDQDAPPPPPPPPPPAKQP